MARKRPKWTKGIQRFIRLPARLDLGQDHFNVRATQDSRLMHGCHKNVWSPRHSTVRTPRAPGDKLNPTIQVMSEEESFENQINSLLSTGRERRVALKIKAVDSSCFPKRPRDNYLTNLTLLIATIDFWSLI